MNKKFICIEGNIGSGKTTLSNMLVEHFKAKLLLENFEENPYLKDFYKDTKKYALHVELSFLADRYQQQLAHINEDNVIVSDYLFDKSLIFAGINLQPAELKIFTAAFTVAKEYIRNPDIIIFLDAAEDLLKHNIKKRGRNFEENIPTAYLQKVTNAYHTYFKNNTHLYPIIWVNVNKYNVVGNEKHFNRLVNMIKSKTDNLIHYI